MPRQYKQTTLAPPAAIPIDTDVFAIFDTTSMSIADAESATQSLTAWHSNLPNQIAGYTGKLYIIPYNNENWVNWPQDIHTKNITPTTTGGWSNVAATYRPTWSNFPTIITKIFLLAFIDETNPAYHDNAVPPTLANQPTAAFLTDYTNFITLHSALSSLGGFFKGVCYPIVKGVSGRAFVAHGIAALYGRTIPLTELITLYTVNATNPQYVDLSILSTFNPYDSTNLSNNPPGLNNYNWRGVWDKTSPASSVFNNNTFKDELNDFILEGAAVNSCAGSSIPTPTPTPTGNPLVPTPTPMPTSTSPTTLGIVEIQTGTQIRNIANTQDLYPI